MKRGYTARKLMWIYAAATALSVSANAADWSVKSSLGETVSFNDNPDLSVDSPGFVFGSFSTLDLDVTAKTHLSLFKIYSSLGYQTYVGKGDEAASDGLAPSIKADYEYGHKRWSFKADAAYRFEVGAEKQDLSSSSSKSDRQTIEGSVSATRKVNARNEVTASLRGSNIDYFDPAPDDIASSRIGASVSWLHRATKRVDFSTSAGVDRYDYDNFTDTRDYVWYLREDVSARVNNRLRVKAGVGVTLLRDYRDDLFAPGAPRLSSTEIGWLAHAGFDYKLKSTTLSGNVDYGLSPDSDGELQESLAFGFTADHAINEASRISLTGSVRLAETGVTDGFDETTYNIGPVYTQDLARYWQFRLGYQLSIVDDDEGTAVQNSAFVGLKREFILLP